MKITWGKPWCLKCPPWPILNKCERSHLSLCCESNTRTQLPDNTPLRTCFHHYEMHRCNIVQIAGINYNWYEPGHQGLQSVFALALPLNSHNTMPVAWCLESFMKQLLRTPGSTFWSGLLPIPDVFTSQARVLNQGMAKNNLIRKPILYGWKQCLKIRVKLMTINKSLSQICPLI